MPSWYLNAALSKLRLQLQRRNPGIVIGSIGDANHSSGTSDHNPDPDHSVDAIDPMIGPSYSFAEAQADVDALVRSRDPRVGYIIFNRRIISSTKENARWVWRDYSGSDPHRNHWHISSRDVNEADDSDWELEDDVTEDDINKIADRVITKLSTVLDTQDDENPHRIVLNLRRVPWQYPNVLQTMTDLRNWLAAQVTKK